MKHRKRIRLLASLLLVFAISATFFSCSTDEDVVRHQHRDGNKLEVKTFEQLRNHPAFQASLGRIKINKQKGDLSRTEFEDQYGFTIVEDMVKVVTDSLGNVTYTLEIIPDVKTDEKLLNLVLKETPIDSVFAHIIKYNSKVSDGDSEEEIKDKGVAQIFDIKSSGIEQSGRYLLITITFIHCSEAPGSQYYCGGDPSNTNYTTSCSHTESYVINVSDGWDSSGGSSGTFGGETSSGNSPGNNSGQGSTGNGGTAPVSTSPVKPELQTTLNPCEKLKFLYLQGNPKVRDQINALKSHALVAHGEKGFQLENSSTTSTPNWISSTILPSPGDGMNNISFTTGGDVTIIGHNHPSNAGAVPSWQDLQLLRRLYENAKEPYNQPFAVCYVVVKNSDPSGNPATLTYAMVVDNIAVLSQWLDQDLLRAPSNLIYEDKVNWVQQNVDNAYYSTAPGGATLQNFFAQHSAGFSLYELKPTGVWNKLTYNSASGTVTATPCP